MNNNFRKPDIFSLELNILFVKAVFTWDKWEESKQELEKLERKEKELREKLEKKIEEANYLKKEVKEFLELTKEISEQRNEVLALANELKIIAKNFHGAWEEIYELYSGAKNQHKEYIERLMRSFKKFWEVYFEIICDNCLTKLEFILKSKEFLGETKKLT